MNYLGTETKNWIIEFKNFERPAEFVSQAKAEATMYALKDKGSQYIERTDDSGSLLELIEKKEIKRVYRPEKDEVTKKMRWVCDCGRKNLMNVWPPDKCKCSGSYVKLK